MKIDLISLREGKNRIHLEKDSSALELPDDLVSKTPVNIEGSFLKLGNQLVLKAEVLLTLETECSRCLESFRHTLRIPIQGYYQIGSGRRPEADEDDIVHIPEAEQRIDLSPLIRETIMLEIPVKPLCREECKGLCPRCGTNLNIDTCGCLTRQTDPRWAALESLRS